MENVTKSIVYGNVYENRYGRFLPVCSSISDRASIQSILDYLHDTPHFKKYNRIAYAFRVEEAPTVFITEKKNVEHQHYESCHSDETIQGSGEKLLHLLQKFNIRNVFLAILIQQFNPLFPFETTNYRAIVQNCRLLLDELYKKVVALQDKAQIKSFSDLLLHNNQTAKLKKCNISDNIELPALQQKKTVVKQRPNHIYANGKPQFLTVPAKSSQSSLKNQIKFLWERCKLMKQQFQSLVQSLEEKQIQQLRYFAMYDKNPLINTVIQLMCILLGVDRSYLMGEYNFDCVRQMKFQIVEQRTLTKLDDSIKSNRKLNVDSIMKANRPIGVIFSLIEIRIKFSKTLKRISQLMEKADLNEKWMEEVEMIKKKSEIVSPAEKSSLQSVSKTEKPSFSGVAELRFNKS